jgi:hypothetical protein
MFSKTKEEERAQRVEKQQENLQKKNKFPGE